MKRLHFYLAIVFLFLGAADGNSQWKQTGDMYGGSISCLGKSGSDLFAGTPLNGLYHSTDNGIDWSKVSGFPANQISDIVFDGPYLFVAAQGFSAEGIFRSADNGASWGQSIGYLNIFDFTEIDTVIFAGSYMNGVYRSTDYGVSWTDETTGLPPHPWISCLVSDGTDLYAGTPYDGPYPCAFISTDMGESWAPVTNGLPRSAVNCLAASGQSIFAGLDTAGIYRSTNNGSSWTAVNSGLTNLDVQAMAVYGSAIFAGTQGGLFRSTDGGRTWSPSNTGLTNSSVHSLLVSDSSIYAGTDGNGVFVSTDGGKNWSPINRIVKSNSVYSLANCGGDIFAAADGGVFVSSDTGRTWSPSNMGLPREPVTTLAVSGNELFAGLSNQGKPGLRSLRFDRLRSALDRKEQWADEHDCECSCRQRLERFCRRHGWPFPVDRRRERLAERRIHRTKPGIQPCNFRESCVRRDLS